MFKKMLLLSLVLGSVACAAELSSSELLQKIENAELEEAKLSRSYDYKTFNYYIGGFILMGAASTAKASLKDNQIMLKCATEIMGMLGCYSLANSVFMYLNKPKKFVADVKS